MKGKGKKIIKTLNTHLLSCFLLLELYFPQPPVITSTNSPVTNGLMTVTVMELMVKWEKE